MIHVQHIVGLALCLACSPNLGPEQHSIEAEPSLEQARQTTERVSKQTSENKSANKSEIAAEKNPRKTPEQPHDGQLLPNSPAHVQELLAQVQSADGSVRAEWWGVAPQAEPHESPFSPLYGTEMLTFHLAEEEPHPLVFEPAGTLFFSDWTTDIFSPDGERIVLLQDRFGPYHVITRQHLAEYLRGVRPPDLEITWATGPADQPSFTPVHSTVRWLGPRLIEVLYASETPEWRRYQLP